MQQNSPEAEARDKARVTLQVPVDYQNKLVRIAKAEDRSIASLVRLMVKEGLERRGAA